MNKKAIGGYLELELNEGKHYHKGALRLNTARNCLEYILRAKKYKKLYIPYYTCEVILEPLKKWNIAYEFYSINYKLEPNTIINLNKEEAFLYTNYYGLKQSTVKKMSEIYGRQLIVDNSQAFFAPQLEGIDTFYSPRKFFGVADGSYLYIDKKLDEDFEQDTSYDRMGHLLKRIDVNAEFGYSDFIKNSNFLRNQPIKRMSKLTEKILCSIDYDLSRKSRIGLYREIDSGLKEKNLLNLEIEDKDVPMIYPFLVERGQILKQKLIAQRVYIPTYWENVLQWSDFELELYLTKNLLAIPLNQNICNILKRIDL